MKKPDNAALIDRIYKGDEPFGLDLDAISRYHSVMFQNGKESVSEATWTDLEMDEVFFRKTEHTAFLELSIFFIVCIASAAV